MSDYSSLVEYVTFDLNQIPPEIKKSQELKEYILLKTQGYPIELLESPKVALSMFAFNLFHPLCPEVTLVMANGEKYAIYDHSPIGAIRPRDVNMALAEKEDFGAVKSNDEVSIDLEEIWNSIENSDFIERIKVSVEKVKDKIARTPKTTIHGDVPLFLILATQHLVGNNTQQLFYQRNADSNPQRVK